MQQPARRRCLDVDDIEEHEPKSVQGVEEDREEECGTRTPAAASSRRARGPRRIGPARSRRARRRGRGGGERQRRRPRSSGVRGTPSAAHRGRSRGRSARSSRPRAVVRAVGERDPHRECGEDQYAGEERRAVPLRRQAGARSCLLHARRPSGAQPGAARPPALSARSRRLRPRATTTTSRASRSSSRSGKSARKWAPRDSSRARADSTISRATVSWLSRSRACCHAGFASRGPVTVTRDDLLSELREELSRLEEPGCVFERGRNAPTSPP